MPERNAGKTGRPSLLTAETTKKICELLRTGAHLETCAEAVGVWPQALSEWRRRARECVVRHNGDIQAARADEQDGYYVKFAEDIARAYAETEIALVERVRGAAKGAWGSGWLLERVHRDRYSTRSEAKVDAALTINAEGGADADAAAKLRTEAFLAGASGKAPAPGGGGAPGEGGQGSGGDPGAEG